MTKSTNGSTAAAAAAMLMGNDVAYMKKDISDLQSDMKLIMEDRIPNLKEDIASLSTKITLFTAINIGGIILGVIVSQILR